MPTTHVTEMAHACYLIAEGSLVDVHPPSPGTTANVIIIIP